MHVVPRMLPLPVPAWLCVQPGPLLRLPPGTKNHAVSPPRVASFSEHPPHGPGFALPSVSQNGHQTSKLHEIPCVMLAHALPALLRAVAPRPVLQPVPHAAIQELQKHVLSEAKPERRPTHQSHIAAGVEPVADDAVAVAVVAAAAATAAAGASTAAAAAAPVGVAAGLAALLAAAVALATPDLPRLHNLRRYWIPAPDRHLRPELCLIPRFQNKRATSSLCRPLAPTIVHVLSELSGSGHG
mmetsp:Transcript_125766/g.250972  ORF Transcript_125766/g.250972 Transcript_125766/m.250972 type:complete len:242 (-) Transcript_125766:442-1167(-)